MGRRRQEKKWCVEIPPKQAVKHTQRHEVTHHWEGPKNRNKHVDLVIRKSDLSAGLCHSLNKIHQVPKCQFKSIINHVTVTLLIHLKQHKYNPKKNSETNKVKKLMRGRPHRQLLKTWKTLGLLMRTCDLIRTEQSQCGQVRYPHCRRWNYLIKAKMCHNVLLL